MFTDFCLPFISANGKKFIVTRRIKGEIRNQEDFFLSEKDEDGNWGNTFSKAIMANPSLSTRDITIQAAEYFWDTDPGQGAGTSLVAFDGNFNQAIETAFGTIANFPNAGLHLFKIPTKGGFHYICYPVCGRNSSDDIVCGSASQDCRSIAILPCFLVRI